MYQNAMLAAVCVHLCKQGWHELNVLSHYCSPGIDLVTNFSDMHWKSLAVTGKSRKLQ